MTRENLAKAARGVNWWTVAKTVAMIGVPIAVAFGFDFKTPAAKFAEQDRKIDTLHAQVVAGVASVDTIKRSMNEGFDLIFRLNCLDTTHYSQRDLRLAGLNCQALLSQPVTQAGRVR